VAGGIHARPRQHTKRQGSGRTARIARGTKGNAVPIATRDQSSRAITRKGEEGTELTTKYAREQFEAMTKQTRELAALAQKMTLEAADLLKSRATKAFS
jgi:hypothetical protein